MNWESPFVVLFIGTLVRPLLLAGAAILAVRLFRIQHPASQHAMWRVVLIGLLAVPVVSFRLPHVDLPLLPAEKSSGPAANPVSMDAPASVIATGQAGFEIHPLLLREQGVVPGAGSVEIDAAGASTDRAAFSIGRSSVFYIYLTGFLAIAGYYITGWFMVRRLSARSHRLRSTPIFLSEDVIVPATIGFFSPRVIVPADWADWDIGRRRVVLAHEFAHIRRKDLLTAWLAHCVKCVLWFNPLAWWVARKVSRLAEMACDAVALQKTDPAVYSRVLLDFAGKVHQAGYRARVHGLAMASSSNLQDRIDAVFSISKGGLRKLSRPGFTLALAGIPLLWAVSAVGLSQVAAPISAPLPAASPQPVASSSSKDPASDQVLLAAAIPAAVAPAVTTVVAPQSTPSVQTFLTDHCIQCHSTERSVAGVALDKLALENPTPDAKIWERVLRTLRARSMPPIGIAHPSRVINNAVIDEIERALDAHGTPATWPARTEPLSDEALASRLSNFIWSAAPDNELLNTAKRGVLKDPKILEQQVKRMLADPQSRAFVTNFFGGWLGLHRIRSASPSPQRFPDFDEGLRDAMQRETEMFLDHQLREDRSALELVTADYTFLNDRLARHYGIPNVSGSEFRRVTLSNGRRAGVLGHASILTITSTPDRISPNQRGKWILMTILGLVPPDPPPTVSPLPGDEPGKALPIRTRMEQTVASPQCRSCHMIIDPPGYALENFNAIGQWQDTEASMPVDASGTFPDGTVFNGPEQFRAALLDRRSSILNNISEKLLTYALGRLADNSTAPRIRALEYYEMPAVRAIVQEAASQNYSWSALITAVAKSAPFQSRVVAGNQ